VPAPLGNGSTNINSTDQTGHHAASAYYYTATPAHTLPSTLPYLVELAQQQRQPNVLHGRPPATFVAEDRGPLLAQQFSPHIPWEQTATSSHAMQSARVRRTLCGRKGRCDCCPCAPNTHPIISSITSPLWYHPTKPFYITRNSEHAISRWGLTTPSALATNMLSGMWTSPRSDLPPGHSHGNNWMRVCIQQHWRTNLLE
jgi:hypothetical protein